MLFLIFWIEVNLKFPPPDTSKVVVCAVLYVRNYIKDPLLLMKKCGRFSLRLS